MFRRVASWASCRFALVAVVAFCGTTLRAAEPEVRLSPPSQRPLGHGPIRFVDAARGDDAGDGTLGRPWRSVGHGLAQLAAGETLCLRGGTYYERVRISLVGTDAAPIVVRGYPGETAVLDAGYPEFFASSATAWEPVVGSLGEFRSVRRYGNLRYVLGSFGDSMIGLHTYYHAQDLRAAQEGWHPADANDPQSDVAPVYCGPGLWYDAAAGRIHVRLHPTHLRDVPNYDGPTDPRRVPLVVAPADAVPLTLDGAAHVRLEDLTIRGGGHDTVVLRQTRDVTFDGCTIHAASNGIRAVGAVGLRITRCGAHGNLPPWTFRAENSLRNREGRGRRDITRLNTHALLVPAAGREFDVYAFPQNDDWEISYSDFTDAHDGLYFGGVTTKFHHNRVARMQDDGLYLSPMYVRYYEQPAELRIYENVLSECLTAVAFGGSETINRDRVFLYRNLWALDTLVPTARPAQIDERPTFTPSKPMGDHGSPPWSALCIYHNTVRLVGPGRSAEQFLTAAATPERPRHFLNNVVEVVEPSPKLAAEIVAAFRPTGRPLRFPPLEVPAVDRGSSDGNLYWVAGVDAAEGEAMLRKYRTSPPFAASREVHAEGFTARSRVANPRLDADGVPAPGSPVVDAGASIPAAWPDSRRDADRAAPDIGAIPAGATRLRVGRFADGP